jgi:hypothetical protein
MSNQDPGYDGHAFPESHRLGPNQTKGQPAAPSGLTEATGSGSGLLNAALEWGSGIKEYKQHRILDADRKMLAGCVSENDGDIASRILTGEVDRLAVENADLRRRLEYIDKQVRECWPEDISAFSEIHRQWCIKMAREILRPNNTDPQRRATGN